MTVRRIIPPHLSAFGISDIRANLRAHVTIIPPLSARQAAQSFSLGSDRAANDADFESPAWSEAPAAGAAKRPSSVAAKWRALAVRLALFRPSTGAGPAA